MNIKEVAICYSYKQCSSEYFYIVFFSYLKGYSIICENLMCYKVVFKIVGNIHSTLIEEIN